MYRVVFFGEPGSGKTTLSQKVAVALGVLVVEASREVIFPAAMYSSLPDTTAEFITIMMHHNEAAPTFTREKAREMFSRLCKTYASDIVAGIPGHRAHAWSRRSHDAQQALEQRFQALCMQSYLVLRRSARTLHHDASK